MDTLPIQDRTAALGHLLGRDALLRRLEDVFAQEIPDTMSRLRLAVGRGDITEAEHLAHSIKGQAATIGALAASAAAKAVEIWARSDAPGRPTELVDALDLALEAILVIISERADP